jgi:phosphatidylserine decarboxylase
MSALTYATAQLLRVLPRAGISRVMGRAADRAWPAPINRAVIRAYSKFYRVSLDECLQTEGWTSFDEFFTRGLRDGARPIAADPRTVVSPSDGRVESMGPVDMQRTFTVKGRPYRVEELVGDRDDALRYEGGAGCVIYLSPRDYHRVHAPVDGTVSLIRSMPGDYYPVNSIGVKHVPNLFARNRRVAFAIDTPPETGLGRVTVVMVAAIVVGRITATGVDARDVPFGNHVIAPPRVVKRGDEIGVFHLGSTAVVFFERRAVGAAAEWLVDEGAILYGQRLLQAVPVVSAPAVSDAKHRKTNGRAR